MATAIQKQRTTRQVARRARGASQAVAIAFVVFEDNAGDYRWAILDSRGENLAQSETFATYDGARKAAEVIRDAAGSSQLERRPADRPVDLVARREATRAHDDSDAERWLDESESFDSEAVTPWPGER
jgi:uncharacterized protein YegP (UPF0339 family)